MPQAVFKGVLFDMDGVLIDSYEAHFESWRLLAAKEGRDYTREQFIAGFGRTSREVIAEQWGPGPLTGEQIRQLDDQKEALFREIIRLRFPAMPGAAELVESLANEGFRIAVASSGPAANVRMAIENLKIDRFLSAIVTGSDVRCGKPDPQVFLLASERINAPPHRCVVVEDAPVGIKAARRGGMRVIGVASTGRTSEQLASADLVVQSLRELSPTRFEELLKKGR